MKNRSELWLRILADAGIRCSVSTAGDANNVISRVESEGESFFTLSLPQFSKDLETALEDGILHTSLFRGFARSKSLVTVTRPGSSDVQTNWVVGGIPHFLGGFLELIFDSTWEVTYEQWEDVCLAVSTSRLTLHNFFAPSLRIPKDLEEELVMAEAIMCVRQLAQLFSKEKSLCSDKKVQSAYESYVDVDKELNLPFMTGESTE